jgi:hypothetical protein
MSDKNNSIPKVCKENWLELTPSEKVKFCQLCQKNVFDYDDNNEAITNEFVCLRHGVEINNSATGSKLVDKITNLLIKKK